MSSIPPARVTALNDRPGEAQGHYVLYWMVASRRLQYNWALQYAVALANEISRPLVIFEPLRCGYRWASDRLHRFVLEGMIDNAATAAAAGVAYLPYLEAEAGQGHGLLETLAEEAACVVTDDYPAFFLPRMTRAAAARLDVACLAVDSNGILPIRATDRAFPTAFSFRKYVQRHVRARLDEVPACDPLDSLAVRDLVEPLAGESRWAAWDVEEPLDETLAALPIDHSVRAGALAGGRRAGVAALREFVDRRLPDYAELRNHPDEQVTSNLSPYLHFGHVSAHEIFLGVAAAEDWRAARMARKSTGGREGFWNMSASAEAFLDQLITWRELGFTMCVHRPDYDRYESLPDWALTTLREHESDERQHLYTHEQLERAETHDTVWNAAQRQLVQTGLLHNYLRMLWGKKVLKWSPTPGQALATLIELNNKYGLDGRDPNSYSGIFWTLGRYDRPWGPERPVFGKVRYMTSANTARKVRLKQYLQKYGSESRQSELFSTSC